ncbi:MAG: hypothetical protein EBX50_13215 [Chitinophagia bacterium]|nr:hypothetical protein [Chitinophagia bacterium]
MAKVMEIFIQQNFELNIFLPNCIILRKACFFLPIYPHPTPNLSKKKRQLHTCQLPLFYVKAKKKIPLCRQFFFFSL